SPLRTPRHWRLETCGPCCNDVARCVAGCCVMQHQTRPRPRSGSAVTRQAERERERDAMPLKPGAGAFTRGSADEVGEMAALDRAMGGDSANPRTLYRQLISCER